MLPQQIFYLFVLCILALITITAILLDKEDLSWKLFIVTVCAAIAGFGFF
jgi:uncharacterized membrane protein YccC